jgi:hypothetical protein
MRNNDELVWALERTFKLLAGIYFLDELDNYKSLKESPAAWSKSAIRFLRL